MKIGLVLSAIEPWLKDVVRILPQQDKRKEFNEAKSGGRKSGDSKLKLSECWAMYPPRLEVVI